MLLASANHERSGWIQFSTGRWSGTWFVIGQPVYGSCCVARVRSWHRADLEPARPVSGSSRGISRPAMQEPVDGLLIVPVATFCTWRAPKVHPRFLELHANAPRKR